MEKSREFNTLHIVKYICICTIGSAVLMAAKDLREAADNNVLTINVATIFAYMIMMVYSLCYAEIKEIFHEEGGDFVYIGKFYNETVASIFSLSILLLSGPGVNTIFMCEMMGVYGIEPGYIKHICIVIGALLVSPLCLIPPQIKGPIVKYLGLLQQLFLVLILVSLPLSMVFTNNKIHTNDNVIQGEPTFLRFIDTLSCIYFSYVGFNEGNSMHRNQTGPLFKPYMISTTVLFLIYDLFINLFLIIYRNDSSEIKYKNVLGFLGSADVYVYRILCTVLYSLPFIGLSFLISNNMNYLMAKYKLNNKIKYLIVLVMMGLNVMFNYIGVKVVMNIVCAVMIFFSTLSMAGIIKYKYQHKDYKSKIPMSFVYLGVVFGCMMFTLNIAGTIRQTL